MNTFQRFTRSFAEPTLTFVLFIGMVVGTMYMINPKYITHPSHFMDDVPNELYLHPVKEMPNCHERVKRMFMVAGEMVEEEISPNVTIMICDRWRR